MSAIHDESTALVAVAPEGAAIEVGALDRLSALLESFSLRTRALTERRTPFAMEFGGGSGSLHVLREGSVEVVHRCPVPGLPERLRFDEPTILLYLSPVEHVLLPVGAATTTCAEIEVVGGAAHPLAQALPPLVAVRLDRVAGLGPAVELLCAEVDHVQCGHRVLADRLFEVVLIQLLRWIVQHPSEVGAEAGLFAGLSDERIARTLVAIHRSPSSRWTLTEMARVATMSRTSFSARFTELMATTPAAYVTDWRISLAQERLRRGEPVGLIAQALGYGDPSTFSRAFAGRTGVSPRAWARDAAVHATDHSVITGR